jgi:hypothetical protein
VRGVPVHVILNILNQNQKKRLPLTSRIVGNVRARALYLYFLDTRGIYRYRVRESF